MDAINICIPRVSRAFQPFPGYLNPNFTFRHHNPAPGTSQVPPSNAGIEAGKTYPPPRFRKPWHQQNGCLSQRDRPFLTGTWTAELRLGMVPTALPTAGTASPALALCKLQRTFELPFFVVLCCFVLFLAQSPERPHCLPYTAKGPGMSPASPSPGSSIVLESLCPVNCPGSRQATS